MSEPIHLQQVSESTVAAIDPRLGSNAAAIVLDDLIIAVDVGMRPYAARLFRETLEDRYRRPVRFVCVTHYHADHTFSLHAVKDLTLFACSEIVDNLRSSPDWTPEALAGRREDDPDGGEWLDEVEFVVPSLLFHGRMDIVNGGRCVEFHHSGGHTSCSVYGYYPAERILLAGDLLFAGQFPFAGDRTADPEVWMSTLRASLAMDIEYVIPGHGAVVGTDEIGRQLEFFEILKHNTIASIAAGQDHRDIAVPAVYPVVEGKEWFTDKTLARWHSYYQGRT